MLLEQAAVARDLNQTGRPTCRRGGWVPFWQLRHGANWYDYDHLEGTGRELFTSWLGDRLVAMGVWP